MVEPTQQHEGGEPAAFTWHPVYAGRQVDSVRRQLTEEIAHDQSAYQVILDNAEREEHQAFQSLRDLEKRWSDYDFGWSEAKPAELADRIVGLELERERRQEMIDWTTYRNERQPIPRIEPDAADWRSNMSDAQRRKVANIGAAAVLAAILLLVVLIIVVVF